MWDVIRDLVKEGATLLLTTQYLEEADELADKIAVIDHGKVIARGTSDELKSEIGGERIEVVVRQASDIPRVTEMMKKLDTTDPRVTVDEHTRRLSMSTNLGPDCLLTLVRELAAEQHRDRRHRPPPADARRRLPGTHRRDDRGGGRSRREGPQEKAA